MSSQDLSKTFEISKILKKKGYFVAVNLMQISEINNDQIIKAAELTKTKKQSMFLFRG